MLNPTVLHQYKNQTRDSASLMPDMSGKNILMGFWHNWAPEQGQGYQGGMFTEMALTDIPVEYNVVAVAFMKGSGIPTFKPYRYSDAEFRQQINVLNAQGRAVLISLGGADAHIELYAGQEDMLAYELIRLVETYGFDGLDIDLEQSAITFADNRTVIPAALRMVKQHYAQEGKNFIISMAPEFPYLRDSGSYLAYLKALEDIYDFIAPQYYNQGGDGVWVDELNQLVKQNDDAMKEDFLYYLTDSLVHGTRGFTAIPADKFIIGLPANIDGAANGYVIHPQDAINALERLDKAGNPIRGLMTWSVSWDDGVNKSGKPYDWEFVTRYGFLTGGGSGEKPSAPPIWSPRRKPKAALPFPGAPPAVPALLHTTPSSAITRKSPNQRRPTSSTAAWRQAPSIVIPSVQPIPRVIPLQAAYRCWPARCPALHHNGAQSNGMTVASASAMPAIPICAFRNIPLTDSGSRPWPTCFGRSKRVDNLARPLHAQLLISH
ncbi:Chitinase D precursor [Serratia plymuthica]|uniref:chitinase n=1 Tax=Serratia plymuthica TaxID=82996 RepID=A0A2X4UK83_SERPL|nr:Chitinase D precursor [Serratia plymuthica]